MIVSQDALRRDLVRLLNEIELQIKAVKAKAEEMGIPPEKMRDASGNWVMTPLLLAKAQVYSTLVALQTKK